MILIDSDLPQFYNDISEEIRLFFGKETIREKQDGIPDPDCRTLKVRHGLDLSGMLFTVTAEWEGRTLSQSAELPSTENRLVRKRLIKRCLKSTVFRILKANSETETPWGSLTGVRPSKLFRELCDTRGPEEARRILRETYDVSPEKITLSETIYRVQKPVIDSVSDRDIDVYVNIPFCVSKCRYCSFPSRVLPEGSAELDDYLDVLEKDIRFGGKIVSDTGRKVRAVYIGGGTPTVLSPAQLERLLVTVAGAYPIHGIEYTVESGRPDTITAEKLRILKEHGVTRISINPQTMNADTLVRMGRNHTPEQIEDAFRLAREEGFDSINMDLIAGLPGEDLSVFSDSLTRVLALDPDDVTVHSLALKRSALLFQTDFSLNERDTACMIELSSGTLPAKGYQPYYMYRQKYMSGNLENIGYAKQGKLCVYNIDMMEETAQIMSHGACAVSKRVYGDENRIERIFQPKDVPTYAGKLDQVNAQKQMLFN
ncbi:MAG: coproporphyrinogen dehydrogenase HemZ [Clostridia bacterium]|nr:coproporphyrinogen dehydrogenase HemZ [Clostridia bacterium]